MDPPRRRLLLLHPRIQQRPPRPNSHVHLPLRRLLLPRRRPRPLHLLRGSLPALPPRGRHGLGCRNLSLLGRGALHQFPAHPRDLHANRCVWLLRGLEYRGAGYDILLRAGDEAEDARGAGLYLCGAVEYIYELSAYEGAAVVV